MLGVGIKSLMLEGVSGESLERLKKRYVVMYTAMNERKREKIREVECQIKECEREWLIERVEEEVRSYIKSVKDSSTVIEEKLYNFHYKYWKEYGERKFETLDDYIVYVKEKWGKFDNQIDIKIEQINNNK